MLSLYVLFAMVVVVVVVILEINCRLRTGRRRCLSRDVKSSSSLGCIFRGQDL